VDVNGGGGASIKFQGGVSLYAPYNMEGLIIIFTNKYICFTAYLKSGGLETNDNYLSGEKKVKNP